MYSESALSVKDATGRQISLLNECQQHYQQDPQGSLGSTPSFNGKRKYHCTEPGCNKSFTTSGHLARHHRIHSGEKNFHCLHAGCPSRFSRQDNMMQHYRTHLSPKSRRHHQQQQEKAKNASIKEHQRRLHSHTMIESESEGTIQLLADSKTVRRVISDPYTSTRSRRSPFHPYQQQSSSSTLEKVYDEGQHNQIPMASTTPGSSPMILHQHHHHHYHRQQQQQQPHHHHATVAHGLSVPRPLVQPLSTLVKPLPMEPESASSPPSYPQPYHLSRKPQRAHSTSSTSSSASFLSPRSPSLSPPPPIEQTDIIYPKNFIQLPPLQQEMHIGNQGQHHREAVSDLIHTVSIFG